MGRQRPSNNDCGEQERVTLPPDTDHTRRNSVCVGLTGQEENSNIPHSSIISPQQERSRERSGLSMDYTPHSTAPSPMPMPSDPQGLLPTMPPTTPQRDYTDDDIRGDVLRLIREVTGPKGIEAADAFEKADEKPPITPDSLAELDMARIINNPRLRNDVNFDRELHFRPNLDGSKGRQKIRHADQYWCALKTEVFMLNYALQQKLSSSDQETYWTRVSRATLVRLPNIFTAIRDILKTLVPDYDQEAVRDRLDVDHLMQQILNGVCDLVDLANWLSKMLTNHCAPMRDASVHSMQAEIVAGAEQNQPDKLVSGLRGLMDVLEAMKLDVANHQIRHMRPLLIEDTVNFQRRYNAHRIETKKLNPSDARTWILDHQQPYGNEPTPLLALTRGLITDLIHNDASSFCPPTFYLDMDRLRGLRMEMHGQIYHSICRGVLRELAGSSLGDSELLQACDTLTISVAAIVGVQGKFSDKAENIAAEVVRVLLDADARYPSLDADLVSLAECRLRERLRRDCGEFRIHAINLAERLIPKVQLSLYDHSKLSAMALQDLLVPQITPPKQPVVGFGAHCEPVALTLIPFSGDPDAETVRRLTHILALHWQVWSNLVYLADCPDRDEDNVSDNGSESTIVQSRAGSPGAPTVPIATDIYAPDGTWLPVSVPVTDVPAGLPLPSPSPKPDEGGPPNNGEPSEDPVEPKNRQPA